MNYMTHARKIGLRINKYYILDLRPGNSLVRWLVSQGFSVFVISWNEPNEENSDISFYDYFLNGVYKVIQFMRSEFNSNKNSFINPCNFCFGL